MAEQIQQTPYENIGGDQGLLNLVEHFYHYMDTLPQAATIRRMHADELGNAKQKLFKFLSGCVGGPNLFFQEYGHQRLRQRHFPFAISDSDRDQWVHCMNLALDEIEMDAELKVGLQKAFYDLATHMINTKHR
jgi:hemoglobin